MTLSMTALKNSYLNLIFDNLDKRFGAVTVIRKHHIKFSYQLKMIKETWKKIYLDSLKSDYLLNSLPKSDSELFGFMKKMVQELPETVKKMPDFQVLILISQMPFQSKMVQNFLNSFRKSHNKNMEERSKNGVAVLKERVKTIFNDAINHPFSDVRFLKFSVYVEYFNAHNSNTLYKYKSSMDFQLATPP